MELVAVGRTANPPVKTMFGGLDLSAIAKAAEYISRSQTGQAGEAISPPSQPEPTSQIRLSTISTAKAIESFKRMKNNKCLKKNSVETYGKLLEYFARQYPRLPLDSEPLMAYLDQFDGETHRHKLNNHSALSMLYAHAVDYFGLDKNPMLKIERPLINHKPIKTLNLDKVRLLLQTPQTPYERVALDLLLGHGWRQIEVRRILVSDVQAIESDLILCRGKEREEMAPILPETADRLRTLAAGRPSEEHIFLAEQTRHGVRAPLGDDGMLALIRRLYKRAKISGFTGHDLRRTFATLVVTASKDEYLAMRLLRDSVPVLNGRYIRYPVEFLVKAMQQYSPLRQLEEGKASLPAETSPKPPLSDNTGTTPFPEAKEKTTAPEPPKIVLNTTDSPASETGESVEITVSDRKNKLVETGVESALAVRPAAEPQPEAKKNDLILKTIKFVQNKGPSPVSETGEGLVITPSERENGMVETGEG